MGHVPTSPHVRETANELDTMHETTWSVAQTNGQTGSKTRYAPATRQKHDSDADVSPKRRVSDERPGVNKRSHASPTSVLFGVCGMMLDSVPLQSLE